MDLRDRVSARRAVVMATRDAAGSLSRGPTATIEQDPQHGNRIERRRHIHTGALALEPHAMLYLSPSHLTPSLSLSISLSCVNTFPTPTTSDACASRSLISPSLYLPPSFLYSHPVSLSLALFRDTRCPRFPLLHSGFGVTSFLEETVEIIFLFCNRLKI